MLFDAQPTPGELPTDGCHPTRGGNRDRRLGGNRLRSVPSREMWTRASWVDARGCAEMLSEVEQHVDHARPHLPRRRQRTHVVTVADNLPLAAEDAVDGERQSDREPVHTASGTARLIALDDEVPMVLLDRKMDHAESIDGRPGDRASERPEHPRGPERWKPGRRSDGDLQRVPGFNLRSRRVRHRRTAPRLSPRALSRTTPAVCHLERQLYLPWSCRLDSAHVSFVGLASVELRGSVADSAPRDHEGCVDRTQLIRRMFRRERFRGGQSPTDVAAASLPGRVAAASLPPEEVTNHESRAASRPRAQRGFAATLS
jgi:hypothetical protein